MKRVCCLLMLLVLLSACALAESFTLEALTEGHGSLKSTTGEAVTQEDISAILSACEHVTLENEKTLHLVVMTDLDLMQELLPTYAKDGLVQKGNAVILVCASSNKGTSQQYHQEDLTGLVAAGMMTQQICVAAQMQGLGFRVITDCIYESSYSLYEGNEVSEEKLVKEAMPWEDWVRQFAVPKENYYVMDPGGEPIQVMGGKNVPLKSKNYIYFEADGEQALKRRVQFVEGYMTPVAAVLLGHTGEAPQVRVMKEENLVTYWDGSFDPYPEAYGGSAAALKNN